MRGDSQPLSLTGPYGSTTPSIDVLICFDVLTHGQQECPVDDQVPVRARDRRDRRRGILPRCCNPNPPEDPPMSLLGKLTSTLAITNAAGTTVRIDRTGGGQAGRSMTLPAAYAGADHPHQRHRGHGHRCRPQHQHRQHGGRVLDGRQPRPAGTAGTVSGSAVPITGGEGDNLPTQATAVTICKATTTTVLVFAGSAPQDPGDHLRQAGALRPDRRHHGQPLGLRDPGRRRRLFLVGRRPGRRALQRHRRHGQRLQRRHHGRHADDHRAVDVSKCCAS